MTTRQFIREISPTLRNSLFEHFSVLVNNSCVRVTLMLSTFQIYMIKKCFWFFKIGQFHQLTPHDFIFYFLLVILISSTYTDKNNPCFRWLNTYDQFDFCFLIPVSQDLLQTNISKEIRKWTSVQISFEKNHQCLTMTSTICVVEDVSIHEDILILEYWAILGRPIFLLGCKRTLRRLISLYNQVVLQWLFLCDDSNCLSHNSPDKGWPYRFLSRGTTGSSILDHDFGHLCRGRRIQMSGHSDLGILSNLWASSIFTWV